MMDFPVIKLLPQGVLQVVADVSLAHGDADGERGIGLAGVLGGVRAAMALLIMPTWGPFSVSYDNLTALLDQIHDRLGG